MPVRLESQAEPIPGYKLIERLGGGGFGEVWKATAPGGLFKAIKFVYGDLKAVDNPDGSRAEQELKALSRVKTVHHPFILSLERYDILDGQLIIVMELADRTLHDRFRECRTQGLPGIPRDELLNYMEETAEALDLMNTQYQLQHLDIKPQNLFLVYNHVKVADFGLVKDLEGISATVTGGVTPVYAAPETFDGWVSRYSDQYSLAIVYQELLTGQRPYAGSTMRQLVLQHLQGIPDLSSLPLVDKPAVTKALAKNPDDRYPSCLDFVKVLRTGGKPAEPALLPATERAPLPAAERAPVSAAEPASLEEPTELAKPGPGAILEPELTCEARGLGLRTTPKGSGSPESVLPARPLKRPGAKPEDSETSPGTLTAFNGRPKTDRFALPPDNQVGVLAPALIVGLGQVGLGVLKQLRRSFHEHFGSADALPHVRLLYLDTDADAVQHATAGDAEEALHVNEVLPAKLHRPSHYLRQREGKLPLENWLDAKVLYRIPRQQSHARVRALGRLAFVDNYRTIARRLENELTACGSAEILDKARLRTGLEFRSRTPRVYLVTSLAGGTGSGMFVDLAYLARQCLRTLGHIPQVIGVLLVPQAEPGAARLPALANTFAALTELHHFAYPDAVFTAVYDCSETAQAKVVRETGPAFQRCVLVPLVENLEAGNSPTPAVTTMARTGQFLVNELASSLGRAAEDSRRQRWGGMEPQNTTFHAIGLYRWLWPRRRLLRQAGTHLACRLVGHWMAKETRHLREEIQQWAQVQWEGRGLRLENLITRHQEKCEQALGKNPESLFTGVIGPLAHVLTPGSGRAESLTLAPVVGVMDHLEKMLGLPEECRSHGTGIGAAPELGPVEKALADAAAAIAEDAEQHLAELVVRLIEEPAYRLAGAEEAIRQFTSLVEQALSSQETLAKELHQRAGALFQRIHAYLESPLPPPSQSPSLWRAAFTRKSAQTNPNFGAELLELLRSYPKVRYQSLILQQITALYVSLRGLLSDQLREIGFCRHRLTELVHLIEPPLAAEANLTPPAADKCLLPQGCPSLEAAVTQIDDGVTAEHLLAFDKQVQELLRRQFRALVHVCMASSTEIKTLAPALLHEAVAFLHARLAGSNVVDLYREQFADTESHLLHDDLMAAYDEAAPELARMAGAQEISLIALPAGTPGEALQEPLRRTFPHAKIVDAGGSDEILLYREDPHLVLADLEQLGPIAQEAYRKKSAQDPSSLHSRTDITDWRPAVEVAK